ncbi:MAG TPA: hypothetical protein VNV38_05345 [Stellaceae bacterium]|jgi:hypothetical protein|nr:hypothetical protein [Stellaceae bacterium]
MRKINKVAQQRNEDEGNRTSAREYNESQQRFIRSGQVDQKAREAARDMDKDSIRRELEHAEAIGRRHSAGEDPEITRSNKKD